MHQSKYDINSPGLAQSVSDHEHDLKKWFEKTKNYKTAKAACDFKQKKNNKNNTELLLLQELWIQRTFPARFSNNASIVVRTIARNSHSAHFSSEIFEQCFNSCSNNCFLFEKCAREVRALGASGHVNRGPFEIRGTPFFEPVFGMLFFTQKTQKSSKKAPSMLSKSS